MLFICSADKACAKLKSIYVRFVFCYIAYDDTVMFYKSLCWNALGSKYDNELTTHYAMHAK